MIEITAQQITLNCRAGSREQALQQAAAALEQRGCVAPGFLSALTARENTLSTWLGSGLAMPHIHRSDSHLIRHDSFHILQFPQGVSWETGHIVFLVVVVAARDNQHLTILSGLADLLGDERRIECLSVVPTPAGFISLLKPALAGQPGALPSAQRNRA